MRDHTGWANKAFIAKLSDWGAKADVIRFEVLAEQGGGFTVDADIECLQPLDLPNQVWSHSVGSDRERPLDLFSGESMATYESEIARPGLVSCAFMGAVPGAALFKLCMEEVSKEDPKTFNGAKFLTKMIQQYAPRALLGDRSQVIIYPSRTIAAEHSSGVSSPGTTPIYGKHYFGSAKSYNPLRRWPCQCAECRVKDVPFWRNSFH